ncbi:MAG TPA: fasciclin, partial [Psychrobacter sp.]|nr:fasciclin [Psychrobacter sp.]
MNNTPSWTLAMTLMAVTGCQNTAQSATPVSMTPVSGTSTVVEVSHSGLVANSNNVANQTIRPPNATYSTFTQPSLTTSHSNQVAVPTTV